MFIVANWKAYVENTARAKALVAVAKKLGRSGEPALIVAPPAPLLGLLAASNRSKVGFAAQDVSATLGGAETGEVTAATAAAAGAAYAIIGHSERRAHGDTNEIVAEKIAHAFAHGLTPILCVGEHEHDPEGRYLGFIREEITAALTPLPGKARTQVIIAYEPIWAIGKGANESITPEALAEMALYIRKVLAELLPGKSGRQTRILYGGAVEPGNIRDLAASTGIDGFLVGHASVDPHTYTALVRALA